MLIRLQVSKFAHFPLFSMDVDLCFSYLFPKCDAFSYSVKMTSNYHIVLRWTLAQGYGVGETNRKAVKKSVGMC